MGLKQMFGRGGQTETEPENALSAELRVHHDQAVDQAWGRLRMILDRADNPEPGDRERVLEVLETLGLDERYIDYYLVVLQTARNTLAQAERAPELEKRLEQLKAERKRQAREIDRLREALDATYQEMANLESNAAHAKQQAARILVLQGYFPELLHDYPSGEPRGCSPDRLFSPILNRGRELGISDPANPADRSVDGVPRMVRERR